jgi:acetyltransferase-like isoleucine patch superfamily enzyme
MSPRRLLHRLRRVPVSIFYYRGPRVMSRLRKWWVLMRNPDADIRFGKGSYLGPRFSLHMPYGGTFIAHEGVEFRRGFRAEIGPEGRVEIGKGSYFTYDAIIACSTSITIGERCGIGQDCYIIDGSHRFRDLTKTFLEQGYDFRPIRIEDDAQIHSKCTIVNDIGTRAIIGANAVVTKPIPPFTVAGGVPARVLDYYGPEDQRPPELSGSRVDGASS